MCRFYDSVVGHGRPRSRIAITRIANEVSVWSWTEHRWQSRDTCFSANVTSIWPPFPEHFAYNPALFSIVARVRVLHVRKSRISSLMWCMFPILCPRRSSDSMYLCISRVDTNATHERAGSRHTRCLENLPQQILVFHVSRSIGTPFRSISADFSPAGWGKLINWSIHINWLLRESN